MKQKIVLALGLIAATSFAGAIALPVHAGGNDGWVHGGMTHGKMSRGMQSGQQGSRPHGMVGVHGDKSMMNPQMMQTMMRMHGQMMSGDGMIGSGMMNNPMFKSFDTDGDGRVSPKEMRAGQLAKLEQFDANGNGSLSLDEFEALHSAAIREKMVDKFQALDNDGDGQVTSEEMAARAGKMERRQMMQAQSRKGGNNQTGTMMNGNSGTTEDNN